MGKLLLYIKHHVEILWKFLEFLNRLVLSARFGKQLKAVKKKYSRVTGISKHFQFRLLNSNDLDCLHDFLNSLGKNDLTFFAPHRFDKKTLARVLKTSIYIPLGWFSQDRLIGYFFLRLFANKKSFTGRVVAADFQGRGIGKDMVRVLYRIADEIGFDVFGTASKDNLASLRSHKSVSDFEVIKELPNNYMLIKFNMKWAAPTAQDAQGINKKSNK
jgi:GNAT superfamily N-acetyltransferase